LKLKITLAIAALGAFALSGTYASAGNGDKITGGGQILFSTDGGAGNTIAFTAQGTNTAAKGQVQFIDRSGGKGKNQVKFHGVVDCVETGGNFGVASGYKKGTPADAQDDPANRFLLRVVDNGQGQDDNDMIQFDRNTTDTCGPAEDDDEPSFELGRGNAQVRDGDLSNTPTPDSDSDPGLLALL
jgi:hypothetical protein